MEGHPSTLLAKEATWKWFLCCWQLTLHLLAMIEYSFSSFYLIVLTCLQRGMTPLHLACQSGREKVATVLLEAGAPVEAQDEVSR
jgi:hypothetical protein